MAEAAKPARDETAKRHGARALSVVVWVAAVVVAVAVVNELRARPRTSDAFVRANVIGIAAHVAGNIVELNVRDNERVSAGDVLFVVDPRPYEAAAAEIRANLELTDLEIDAYRKAVVSEQEKLVEARAEAAYAIKHLERLQPLLERQFVTPDEVQKAQSEAQAAESRVRAAEARVLQAARLVGDDGATNVRRRKVEAALANAELNLEYCVVRAPVDGYVTNLNIAKGEYANEGQNVFSIVDDSRWYVLANYRETLLERIEPGMIAEVWLLSCPGRPLRGVVEGVGKAIYQPLGSGGGELAAPPPALDWVRLAQRFPVRIILEETPECSLHSGSTATVRINPGA